MSSIKRIALLTVIIFLTYGCVSTPEQDAYNEAIEAGRHEEAYAILSEICEVNPSSSVCKELDEVSATYASMRLAKLGTAIEESISASDTPLPISKLAEFKEELLAIEEIRPLSEANKVTEVLERETRRTQGAIEDALNEADNSITRGDAKSAFDSLKLASLLDTSIESRFEEFTKEAVNEAYLEALEAKKNDDWRTARKTLEEVRYMNPGYKNVASELEEAEAKDTYAYRIDQGSKAEERGDYSAAIRAYELARTYNDGPEVSELIVNAMTFRASALFDDAKGLARDGFLLSAGISFVKAIDALKDLPKRKRSEVEVPSTDIERLLDELFLMAKAEEEAGNLGKALISFETILAIQPDYPNIIEAREKLQEKIKSRSQQSLAVIPFTGPSYNTDAGNIVTSRLLHFLYNELSDELRILERGALETLIKESEVKTLQSGALNEGIISIIDAEYMLLGDVVDYKVEGEIRDSFKTVRARVGTERELNPEYEQWALNKSGDPPSRYIERPVYENIRYKTSRHRKEVTAIVGYRIVDDRGDIVYTGMAEEKKKFEDESSEGVEVGELSIPEKMADLPSDTELLRKAENVIVEKIGADMKKLFINPELKMVSESKVLSEKGSYNEALEKLVDARFVAVARKVDTDDIDKEIEVVVETAGM